MGIFLWGNYPFLSCFAKRSFCRFSAWSERAYDYNQISFSAHPERVQAVRSTPSSVKKRSFDPRFACQDYPDFLWRNRHFHDWPSWWSKVCISRIWDQKNVLRFRCITWALWIPMVHVHSIMTHPALLIWPSVGRLVSSLPQWVWLWMQSMCLSQAKNNIAGCILLC